MRSIHRWVIAAATSSLVFLGIAGTRAYADNVASPKRSKSAVEQVRDQVKARNEDDGGCGA